MRISWNSLCERGINVENRQNYLAAERRSAMIFRIKILYPFGAGESKISIS